MKFLPFFLAWIALLSGCSSGRTRGPAAVGPTVRISVPGGDILEIPLEDYVVGVVEKEMPADWPAEALKAQAVASRTYALYRVRNPRNDGFDLASDTSDQVFEEREVHHPAAAAAVRETAGEALTLQEEPIAAFFHSCCGGETEDAAAVWRSQTLPAGTESVFQGHADPHCASCPNAVWSLAVPREDLAEVWARLGLQPEPDWSLEIAGLDRSGRATDIRLVSGTGAHLIPATDLRREIGPQRLRSTLFEVVEAFNGEIFLFTGKGFGHGVGLCQWGARGMAEQGFTYRQILEFYYPGAEIKAPQVPDHEDLSVRLPLP